MLNEKIKKALKISGLVLLGLFLLGVYNLFFGQNRKASYPGSMGGEMSFLSDAGLSKNSLSSESISSMMTSPRADMQQAKENVSRTVAVVDSEVSPESDKKVIKTGNINMNVESAEKASEEIGKIAKSNGGDVFSSNFYERTKGYKSGSITVKVPNASFEKAFSEIKKVATHVVSESTSGQDVTEQYADLEIQIRNKKAEEESYLKVLGQATKVEDILAVTREVSRTRKEVESLEGRMKLLNNQVEMSTISINISEDISLPIGEGWRPWEVVKNSFKDLVDKMQGFVDGLINFFIVVLPTLLVYGIIIAALYKIGKKIYIKFFKRER